MNLTNSYLNKANTKSESDFDLKETLVADKQIMLYDDDFNTFDFVIESLIKVCGHDPVQAEQCTFLVHYKGRCSVKKGSYEELEGMCTRLLERGLTAEIQ